MHLKGKITQRKGKTETDFLSIGSFSKLRQQPGLARPNPGGWNFISPKLGWQGPKYVGHLLFPSQVYQQSARFEVEQKGLKLMFMQDAGNTGSSFCFCFF